jgi:hypothetical protein
MGLGVQLENERGDVLATAGDVDRLIPTGDETYVCWGFIDPYGDTVFNTLQMPRFIEELDRLSDSATDDEKQALTRIRGMAEECRDGVHLYLRFIGD